MPENRFCVYIHRRASDLKIFYVGKGLEDRSRTRHGRSQYWQRIVAKHGYVVEIILSGIDELSAFELEAFLIAEIGRENLCNLTNGGEGCSGREMPDHQKAKASAMLKGKPLPKVAILAAAKKNSKPIGTVCGMRFDSARLAAAWLRNNGFPTACAAGILSSLKGISEKAYGYSWVYQNEDGSLCEPRYKKSDYDPRKPVGTSCGLRFDSAKSASDWLRENGHPKALPANITANCQGRMNKAHGFRWGYIKGDDVDLAPLNINKRIVPVCNSMGFVFYGQKEAAAYMTNNFGIKTSQSGISACIIGKLKHVNGVMWSVYQDDKNVA